MTRDVRHWQQYRQQVAGVSPKTINRNLVSLRRFCQWAVDQKLLPDNPATGVQELHQEKLLPRFLPEKAVDTLLRAPRTIKDSRLRLRDQALRDWYMPVSGRKKCGTCNTPREGEEGATGAASFRGTSNAAPISR